MSSHISYWKPCEVEFLTHTTATPQIKEWIKIAVTKGRSRVSPGWAHVKFVRDFMESKAGGHWNVFTDFADGGTAAEPGTQAHFMFNGQRFVVYQSYQETKNNETINRELEEQNQILKSQLIELQEESSHLKKHVIMLTEQLVDERKRKKNACECHDCVKPKCHCK